MPRGTRRFPHGAYSGPVDPGASLPGPHRAENEPPTQGDNQPVVESRGGASPVGGRWLIRCFRRRAAGRLPWVRFLPPLSEPGVPISGTGLSSGIMRLAHGFPVATSGRVLASPGTGLVPLRWPAGASSGLLTPRRQRPLRSSPSLVHVMTSGVSAHFRGPRPSATPVSLLPFAIAST